MNIPSRAREVCAPCWTRFRPHLYRLGLHPRSQIGCITARMHVHCIRPLEQKNDTAVINTLTFARDIMMKPTASQ